jgi:hypothetical protein
MSSREIESLGPADLKIAGLRIWVHGRQFPDSKDYWDGNWLRVTAHCASESAHVRVHGAIIHLGEIEGLKSGCEVLSQTLAGSAVLDCIEPMGRPGVWRRGRGWPVACSWPMCLWDRRWCLVLC